MKTATEDCRLKEARIAVIIECRVRSLVIWFVVHPFVITIAITRIGGNRLNVRCFGFRSKRQSRQSAGIDVPLDFILG
jgi:hypothetical protein